MNRYVSTVLIRLCFILFVASVPSLAIAQTDVGAEKAATTEASNQTAAAAAVASGHVDVRTPDFLEHVVDGVLDIFDVRSSGNTTTHYIIAALFVVGAIIVRGVVTRILFGILKRLAARTRTTLDDKLFPALRGPVGALILLVGVLAALKVLKLSPASDEAIAYGSTIAFSLVLFWLLLSAFNTLLGHLQDIATAKQLSVAAFMPWIRKTLLAIFVIFGVLMVAQSLGADVKAFLAGLGIGGLAMALAAQDTIANLFGSVVVAVDQPFKLGETVKIGPHTGTVEDIGLRSTKLRNSDKSLTIVPNKTVAAEAVVNLSRFTQRRVEQVISLTYASKPEDMDALVNDFQKLILAEPEVDKSSVMVYFRDLNPTSLDIWLAYMTRDNDFKKHMALRQRLNGAFMRAVAARGLTFATPTPPAPPSVYITTDVVKGSIPAQPTPPASGVSTPPPVPAQQTPS